MSRAPPAAQPYVPDNNERGEWADPSAMNLTYALLYNTIDATDAFYLPNQLDERMWQSVYAPSVRNRRLCWADGSPRAFDYRPQQAAPEIASATSNEKNDGSRKRAIVDRPRRSIRPTTAPINFTPPVRNRDSGTGRSFEVQHNEGFLCPLHTLNNIANSVLLSPPDMLQAIELVRTLEPNIASLEELSLAALREGVFLLPIALTDASALNPLDAEQTYPELKFFLTLLEEARGMIIYTPAHGFGYVGHFVSLVYAEPGEGGLDPSRRWLVYSTSSVVARGTTAAEALDKYILMNLSTGSSSDEKTREERRRRLQESNIDPQHFIGLLPLPIHLLWDDAMAGRDREERAARMPEDEYLRMIVLRTLLRRSLGEMRVQPNELGLNDITMPKPVSPNSVDELAQFMQRLTSRIERDGSMVWNSVFDGFDQTNVASFILRRHDVDVRMNKDAETLALLLLREYDNGWSADPIPIVDGSDVLIDATTRYSYENTRYSKERPNFETVLGNLRRMMREPDGGIGLMFSGVTGDERGEMFSKFVRLLPNRRWLRYLVIDIVASALDTHVRRLNQSRRFPLGVAARRVMVLLTICAFTSLRYAGVNPSSTPNVVRLLNVVRASRTEMLPVGSLPDMLEEPVRRGSTDTGSPLVKLMLNGGYEWYLWLWQAAIDAGLPGLDQMQLEPFWTFGAYELDDRPPFDDNTAMYDRMFTFVRQLRTTLFRIPAADEDFRIIRDYFYEQDARQRTRVVIAEHFHVVATTFVTAAVSDRLLPDVQTAQSWVDFLAFDGRYGALDDVGWRTAAGDVASHLLENNLRPAFIERAAQSGFVIIRRDVFGPLQTVADTRTPITTNMERLPLPNQPGNWRSTRPVVDARVRLCTSVMSALPWWRGATNRPPTTTSTAKPSPLQSADDGDDEDDSTHAAFKRLRIADVPKNLNFDKE